MAAAAYDERSQLEAARQAVHAADTAVELALTSPVVTHSLAKDITASTELAGTAVGNTSNASNTSKAVGGQHAQEGAPHPELETTPPVALG